MSGQPSSSKHTSGQGNTTGYGSASPSDTGQSQGKSSKSQSGTENKARPNSMAGQTNKQDLETALYNRLHPPSSMPPKQYNPSALGYSSRDEPSDRNAAHFARIPLQKKHELRARVARLEEATRGYVAQRAQNALERSIVPGMQGGTHGNNGSGGTSKSPSGKKA